MYIYDYMCVYIYTHAHIHTRAHIHTQQLDTNRHTAYTYRTYRVTEFIPSVPLCTALPPWARFTPEARMASFPYIIRVYDKSRYTRRPPFMKNVVLQFLSNFLM